MTRSGVRAAIGPVVLGVAVLATSCADSSRPTVAPVTSAVTTSVATTVVPSSTASTASASTATPLTTVATTTSTVSPGTTSSVLSWDAPSVIAGLAPLVGPDVPVYVDQYDGAVLVRAADESATGPVLGVIEPGGRTSVAPRDVVPTTRTLGAARFGDHLLVAVQPADGPPLAVVHAFGTDRWEKVAVDAPLGAFVNVETMGSRAVLAFNGPTDAVGSETWLGYVVDASGRAVALPEPPEPAARPGAGAVTLWGGLELLVMARDSAADDRTLSRPYAFDPATLAWRALATPPWLTCGTSCAWYGPHEGGAPFLLAMAAGRAVLHGYVGSANTSELFTGAYDPVADRWQELAQPPVQLELAASLDVSTAAAPALVAVPTSAYQSGQPGTAARLDLVTGTWTAQKLPVRAVGRAGAEPGLAEVRRGADVLLVAVYTLSESVPERPEAVLEQGVWRPATGADSMLWRRLGSTQTTLRQLLA